MICGGYWTLWVVFRVSSRAVTVADERDEGLRVTPDPAIRRLRTSRRRPLLDHHERHEVDALCHALFAGCLARRLHVAGSRC
jgi:hypothetical protein